MAHRNLIDGRAIAQQLQAELRSRIGSLKHAELVPGLAFVQGW